MSLFAHNNERKALEEQMRQAGRLPPGQAATLKWPVLHYGEVPRFDPQRWDFRVFGLVEQPLRFTYEEFLALPQTRVEADMHCVTRWSRFDNRWEGVPAREVVERARPRPEAKFVLLHAEHGFTANLPLEDLMRENVLFAHKHDAAPLAPEHGFPLRLVVPHLYAWKSVKWVRGLEFLPRDVAGFWERNGYHLYGDPWKEQRFDTDWGAGLQPAIRVGEGPSPTRISRPRRARHSLAPTGRFREFLVFLAMYVRACLAQAS